ncbi:hypothetical protein BMIN_0697 [Bifidobacterium minimum]|uniref:Uncharacterized protein n=1 Tax=Bifidobacterium minimum TaxID=1693 RepID=A0A087BPN5_9BIFI|nr:hypothetical protein BMIN_0697 [Bifidobacterium minimum]
MATCTLIPSSGSSPRVRGKPASHYGESLRTGIIPASAGQTDRRACDGRFDSDHPRECGANLLEEETPGRIEGSSPRVRGKPSGMAVWPWSSRIIPASAGQTRPNSTRSRHDTDHPRECGANVNESYTESTGTGSSPRVRGKPCD